jgi:hypothetical protein
MVLYKWRRRMNISITGAALAGLLLAGSAADASAWTRQGAVTTALAVVLAASAVAPAR